MFSDLEMRILKMSCEIYIKKSILIIKIYIKNKLKAKMKINPQTNIRRIIHISNDSFQVFGCNEKKK